MPAPPAYSDNGHNGDWASATPADTADPGDWWTIYQDTELNDLEQRCATANQNIAAALHAYEQAHDLVRENKRIALSNRLDRRGGDPQPHLRQQAAPCAGHRYATTGTS